MCVNLVDSTSKLTAQTAIHYWNRLLPRFYVFLALNRNEMKSSWDHGHGEVERTVDVMDASVTPMDSIRFEISE